MSPPFVVDINIDVIDGRLIARLIMGEHRRILATMASPPAHSRTLAMFTELCTTMVEELIHEMCPSAVVTTTINSQQTGHG